MKPEKANTAGKFDAAAEVYERRRYRHPAAIAKRQAAFVTRWCGQLPPGASILELGCAHGFLSIELAQRGYAVTGLDLSSRMIERARRNAEEAQIDGTFIVGDLDEVDRLGLRHFDAVVGLLATFFYYSDRPFETLDRLATLQPKKLIVDLHRRVVPVEDVVGAVRGLGYQRVAWRAYFAPNRVPLPPSLYPALGALERPPLRPLTIRLKDPNIVVCGSNA